MRTATGLALLAAGAILTFAVSARVPGINLQLAGLILMATGIAGMVVPSQASAWVRQRIVNRGAGAGDDPRQPAIEEAQEDDDFAYPAYLLQDPAVLAAEVLNTASAARATSGRSATGSAAAGSAAGSETAGSAVSRPATARAAQRWTPEIIGRDEQA